jgi:hypothetical protein
LAALARPMSGRDESITCEEWRGLVVRGKKKGRHSARGIARQARVVCGGQRSHLEHLYQ